MATPSFAASIVGYGFVISQPAHLHALLHVLSHGTPPTTTPPDTPLSASDTEALDGLLVQKIEGNRFGYEARLALWASSDNLTPVQVVAFYSLGGYGTSDDYAHGYTLETWCPSAAAGSSWFQPLPFDQHIAQGAMMNLGGLATALSFAVLGIDVTLGWIHTLAIN